KKILPALIFSASLKRPESEYDLRKRCRIHSPEVFMATSPTFPGVYIVEVPSGVRPITGVATSIGAFIDRFSRGVADAAVQLFSFADFEREFGGLDTNSEASYAIQQFFLNGGTEANVVRVGPADAGNPFRAANFLITDGANNVFRAT